MPVELIDYMGSDSTFVHAARVSTNADMKPIPADEGVGLLNFLIKNRHGSPFEHAVMKWRIEAPIFVWREFHRHRIASYNEMSGRYTQLPPKFYIPAPDRNLVQVGKPGAYEFVPGDVHQHLMATENLRHACATSYGAYERMLDAGIAKEVARTCLPVNIFSICYVTMNVRALTNFLSLRTKADHATFPSFPQREIEIVAEKLETTFADKFPITHAAWNSNGRVPL